ncbi:MAG TPA: uracil phosphoribosyltransferase [Lutibacter sp.]|nr:uracil phosphoribosyltransferase [Lutibacter sp.]
MHIHNIGETNSVLNTFIAEIRDNKIQKDSMRFRRNIERIGEVLSYEMSKIMPYKSEVITTPLGTKIIQVIDDQIVLCSILRAGLPFHQGLLNYFDNAENAFISAYRKMKPNGDFDIRVEYFASPSLQDKTLILADPMLATGQSLVATYQSLLSHGVPKELHVFSVIGSTDGIDYIKKHLPEDTHLWIATIDETLNDHGYIIPGLGDAGDLAFGDKL